MARCLNGRSVLIPASEWPEYPCDEHGGEGWRATVVSVDRHQRSGGCNGIVGVKCQGAVWYFPIEAVLSWAPLR